MNCDNPTTQIFGASPATIQWSVVRGDTAKIRITFFESNEVDAYDTTGWTYLSSVYNPITGDVDELTVTEGDGYVDIFAPSDITETWGGSNASIVAELPFDLQVTIPSEGAEDDTIWTPVIGNISVIGDVTRGL